MTEEEIVRNELRELFAEPSTDVEGLSERWEDLCAIDVGRLSLEEAQELLRVCKRLRAIHELFAARNELRELFAKPLEDVEGEEESLKAWRKLCAINVSKLGFEQTQELLRLARQIRGLHELFAATAFENTLLASGFTLDEVKSVNGLGALLGCKPTEEELRDGGFKISP